MKSGHSISVADGVMPSSQAQISVTHAERLGDASKEAALTQKSSKISILASNGLEKDRKPAVGRLLPVKHGKAIGTSSAQPALFCGQILLDGRRYDHSPRVQSFSSQKTPQPFLGR